LEVYNKGMRGVVFYEEEKVVDSLISAFEKLGIFMEKGSGTEAFKNLPNVDFDFLITEFPLPGIERKDFFEVLSKLWNEKKIFTIIVKDKSTGLRRGDKQEFIHIITKPVEAEEILNIIVDRLKIPTEELDLAPILESKEIAEKLETGLSHYGVGKFKEAYKEWIEVLRMDNCNAKAIEYIKIAEKEFQNAGIDLSEFRKLTGAMKEGVPEDIKFRGTDIFTLNNEASFEGETIHPLEAFILSNLDGKTSINKILMILPEEQKSCLRNIIAYFLWKGFIKKVEEESGK